MIPPTPDTQTIEHNALLGGLYACEQSYFVARRLQKWVAARTFAEDVARVARQLELNEKGQP